MEQVFQVLTIVKCALVIKIPHLKMILVEDIVVYLAVLEDKGVSFFWQSMFFKVCPMKLQRLEIDGCVGFGVEPYFFEI